MIRFLWRAAGSAAFGSWCVLVHSVYTKWCQPSYSIEYCWPHVYVVWSYILVEWSCELVGFLFGIYRAWCTGDVLFGPAECQAHGVATVQEERRALLLRDTSAPMGNNFFAVIDAIPDDDVGGMGAAFSQEADRRWNTFLPRPLSIWPIMMQLIQDYLTIRPKRRGAAMRELVQMQATASAIILTATRAITLHRRSLERATM